MKFMKPFLLLAALMLLLALPAAALDITEEFCFSAADFTTRQEEAGIFVTAVPSPKIATIQYGGRVVRAGDALPREALDQLTLLTQCVTGQTASMEYYTVAGGKASALQSMELCIRPRRNDPPTAEDSTLETYRNIANSGRLKASDPEEGELTYTLVTEPRRGEVELSEDGSFTYTPLHNKVGKDSFTFTVTDEAGNVSQPATVKIRIKKPTEKSVYADMDGDPDAFSAMWLREEGIFTGASVGGQLCFSPDEAVSRGEFLVMVMKLVDAESAESAVSTGFADEAETPAWLRPYLVSALRGGMISGVSEGDGVLFLAQEDMTQAEAAVMVQNILKLPGADAAQVFSQEDSAVPAWAAEAAAALVQAGVSLELTDELQPLTRRDAAGLLYDIHALIEAEAVSAFYWVQ